MRGARLPPEQCEKNQEHWEHCEGRNESELAASGQPSVLAFARLATEVLAHRNRCRANRTVLVLDDYWSGFLLMS